MTKNNPTRPVRVLLVEDDEADVRLTREALKDNKLAVALSVVNDGVQAIDFLQRRGTHAEAPRPDLILLDLNLPRRNGLEVLGDVKADDDLKDIPIVIMTSSKAEEDIVRSYKLHANCYITKPLDFPQFNGIVKAIDNFWFSIVTLPNHER
jgi:two-component system, chemotaxis family, response regulator Rcp1